MFLHQTAIALQRITQQSWHPTRNRSVRLFSHCCQLYVKQMPPRPKLDPNDVTGTYLKGTGPGGQAINKTNSAVQLIHKPTGIVVKSQETRSRSQNQKIAMGILAEKVELHEKGEKSRAAIKAETKKKRKASGVKKAKRKYKKLEEERRKQMGIEGEENEEVVEEEGEEEADGKEATEQVENKVPNEGERKKWRRRTRGALCLNKNSKGNSDGFP